MRVGIVDPGFEGLGGHHYDWNVSIVEECARRNLEVRIAAHRNVNGEAARLPVERVFSHSIYDEVVYSGWRERIQVRAVDDLAALRGWHLTPEDVLVVHSVARAHFGALSDWMCAQPAEARPRCVVLHNVAWFGGERKVGRYEWSDDFRAAAERLSAATRVTFGAINEALCRDWEAHSGQPARLHPIPCARVPSPHDARPRFAFLGGGRYEKGFDLLPEVLRLLFRACPDAEAVVQSSAIHPSSEETAEQLQELALGQPRLRLYRGAATRDDYRRMLAETTAMLLPYDPFWYGARGSGVFADGMAAGLPLVLPAGTWMAHEWSRRDAGGALFHDWSAPAVAEAATQVARALDDHRARSRRAAERWNDTHSAAAFVDFVLGS